MQLVNLPLALDPAVAHTHTGDRRAEAAAFLFDPPGLSAQDKVIQDEMMAKALHYMGEGMRESLTRLTSTKYYKSGSILGLAADDPRRKDMAEAIGTSDPVERYFGLFSHLREANPNQTDINRNNQGAIIETKLGEKLIDAVMTDPVAARHRIEASRRAAPAHHKKMQERKKKTLLDRKAELEEAEKADLEKAMRKDAEMERLNEVAEEYRRNDAKGSGGGDRSRRSRGGGLQGTWLDVELAGLGTVAKKRDRLHEYLKMFKSCHGCHDCASLRFIFFSAAGAAGIVTQAGKNIGLPDLQARVMKCGDYVQLHGSPKGWKQQKDK